MRRDGARRLEFGLRPNIPVLDAVLNDPITREPSARRDGAFIVQNCAAIPAELLESEFFGHVRGAFTGAHTARDGLFRLADEGTLFLDEIGDLDLGLQAKLLRVLEDGRVRPVGSRQEIDVSFPPASQPDYDFVR